MALNLGELSIALELDNDQYRAGLANAKRDLETLPPAAQREMAKVSRVFKDEGDKSGGLLAQGVRSGFVRNSPLIVAAVAAALAAGAPLLLAAAGIMFGGIAGLAASQSLEVRNAWMETWQDIRAGAVADAQVLAPAFVKMADDIGDAFERMRPQIQEAFADSAPLVDSFTDGIIDLGENAMPGLVRAVAEAGPVFEGLQSFLADVGTGLTDFFDAMSDHSPAAGRVWSSLGDSMAILLPLLGELIGQGSELAADVLPLLNTGLGLVLKGVELLGPALPAVVTGFAALKIAQAATGWIDNLGGGMTRLGNQSIPVLSTAAGKAGAALGTIAAAGPLVGGALALLTFAFARGDAQVQAWGQSAEDAYAKLAKGGEDAVRAQQQLDAMREAAAGLEDGFGRIVGSPLDDKLNEIAAGARRSWAAMDPLQRAQAKVAEWTATLAYRMDDESASAEDVAIAQERLAHWTGVAEGKQSALERAVSGVTSAMIAQAEQALAMANADYAYRSSLEGIDDQLQAIADAHFRQAEAQAAVNDARATGAKPEDIAAAERDLAAATEGVSDAQFELEGSLLAAAEAAGRLAADALPATATELQRQQAAAAGSLGELERLKTEMGTNFPPALQQAIDRLKQSGVALSNTSISASDTAARVRDLGFAVEEVPGQKFVRVDAPTAPQIEQLKALGWHVVNLPNGDVYVAADTATAEAAINYAARPRTVVLRAQTSFDGRGMPERAAGGPVWPGQTFLVGEQGPELVRFAGSGTVIPAGETRRLMSQAAPAVAAPSPAPSSMGGGSGVVINDNRTVNAYGLDEAGLSRRMQQDQQTRLFLAGVRR